MRPTWPVLAALLFLVPPASALHTPGHPAQPMQVFVENPRGHFSPLGDVARVNITVKLDCTLAQSDAPINFTVRDKPSWLFVREMPGWRSTRNNYTGYSNLPCDAATGYITFKEPMLANFTTAAPAYRFANFTVVVTRADDSRQVRGFLQPGYYGGLEVVPPPNVVRVGSQANKAELAFRVRNYGNGETTVRINIDPPPGTRLGSVPEILRLGADQQGGDWDKELNVVLFLDDVRDDFSVKVNVTGFSSNATNPASAGGADATGTVDLQRSVPSPSIALALAAVAAAGVALAQRRRNGSP